MAWETYILRRPTGTGTPARAHWLLRFGNRAFWIGPVEVKAWEARDTATIQPRVIGLSEAWQGGERLIFHRLINDAISEGYRLEQGVLRNLPKDPRIAGLPPRAPIEWAQEAYSAVTLGDMGALRRALDAGVNPALTVTGLTSLLDVAIRENQPMMVEYLLTHGVGAEGIILHARDQALGEALVELLLDRGAVPDDEIDWMEGRGAIAGPALRTLARRLTMPQRLARRAKLFRAALDADDPELLRILMERGLSLLEEDEDGESMLHLMARSRSAAPSLAICLRMVTPHELVWYEPAFTPLHAAADVGNLKALELLLDRGVDPGIRDERGRTACDLLMRYSSLNPAVVADDGYARVARQLAASG